MTHLQRKFKYPQTFWRVLMVTFFFCNTSAISSLALTILSMGMQTTCLAASISRPKNITIPCAHSVFSRDTGNLIFSHSSKKDCISWLHQSPKCRKQIVIQIIHRFASRLDFHDKCNAIWESLEMGTTNWASKRQTLVNRIIPLVV